MNEEIKDIILNQLYSIYDSLIDGNIDDAMIQTEGLIQEVKNTNEVY